MFRTKLNPPKLGKDLVQRPFLIEKLDKGNNLSFILISAPAGFGKSVLIAQWLQHIETNFAWLSLDESMNNAEIFISYFIEMMSRTGSADIQNLKNFDQQYRFLSWEAITIKIIELVSEFPKKTKLILDDYYLIHNKEIHELVETLIRENLDNLQVVIISRWDPPFHLRELRLYQKMLELRMRDLKFEEQEIIQLMAMDHQVRLSEAEINAIYEKTEGWILAIRMILLASAFPTVENKNRLPEILTNDLDQLMSLISENLAPSFFRQMQLSALCNQFNAELINTICDFAFPDSCKADVFVSKLKELNFFLIPTADDGSWYRFHHLFGDILKRQLKRTEPEIISPLYLHISSWYAKKGLIDGAIQYAIKAENFELACELIRSHRTVFLEKGQWWVVQRWLENIPRHIRQANVAMLLIELHICEETWNIEDFSSTLHTLESIGIENSNAENVSLYLFHLGYFLTYIKPNPKKAVESFEKSIALWHDESGMFGGRRALILATSQQMLGLTEFALKSLEAMQENYEYSSKMHVRALHAKIFVHLLSGNIAAASTEAQKFLYLVQNSDFQMVQAWSWYFQGNISFQFFEGRSVTDSFVKTLSFWGVLNYRVYFDTLAGLILFKLLQGDENASKKHLKELKEKIYKLKDSRFRINYESVKARVALINGQGKQELAWAEANWVKQNVASYMFLIDVPELTKIRVIVSHGSVLQVEEALRVLAEVKSLLNGVHNEYHTIDIELLKAMVLHRLGEFEQAQALLEKALLLAEKNELKRPIFEAYQVMPALFRQAEMSTKSQRILIRWGFDVSLPDTATSTTPSKHNLTIREQEIVSLIAYGLRNKEIADQLNISTVTVKSHLTNIYKKLNVPNRTSMLKKVMDRPF